MIKIKKSYIALIILTFFIIVINFVFLQILYSEYYNFPFKDKNIKIGASDIIIITPENSTYAAPMSGYYPATYGFENDEDGNDPEEWVDLSGIGSDFEVISSFQEHNKVVRGYDGDGGSAWNIRNNISAREGTIELWWAVSSIAGGHNHHVDIRDNLNDLLFSIGCLGGNISVFTSGGWYEIPGLTTTVNTWDHVRIDFRSNSGTSYEGLSPNEFKLYYNGIDQGSYSFNKNGDSIIFRMYSGLAASGYYGYYDAIGYSWDPKYNIGDNLDEGLLLSFENTTALDWVGFSLDGFANKTILGNTTIPLPLDGPHNIQVFGNNSIGAIFHSDIRYFTVDTTPPQPPVIPGYNILTLIGISSVIISVFVKRKLKF